MQTNTIADSIVKKAFYESTEKTHIIACWVGILLNLVWAISDYFVQRDYFVSFFVFRLAISVISIVLLFIRKKIKVSIYSCMFVLVLGISIQNSYMWSVMDLAHFEEHTFAYMVLFIGTGMLVLWEGWLSIILLGLTVLSNLIFYNINSTLTPREFVIHGGLMTLTVLLFSLFLIRSRYKLTYNEIKSRLNLELSKQKLEMQNIEIEKQNKTLEYKNKEITDSINYARNIQMASIPAEDRFHQAFDQSFVFYKPKDIVSGDFYWIYEADQVIYYATGDCTGHGVPGGFMTMLGLTFLEEIIAGRRIEDPAEVLNLLRAKIINALNQNGSIGEQKDGMDITICRVDKTNNTLSYASANNSLYVIRRNEDAPIMEKLPADRQPCGFYHNNQPFTTRTVQLKQGDCIYTLTDGYADQFGGPKGKKFRVKELENILLKACHKTFKEQRDVLSNELNKWQGNLEQVDDVLIIGVSV
jgi:serine phosphatase RsbU (regulator of sigma subunit)